METLEDKLRKAVGAVAQFGTSANETAAAITKRREETALHHAEVNAVKQSTTTRGTTRPGGSQ